MAAKYFYCDGGREFGPFMPDDIRSLVKKGTIVPGTPLRKSEDASWVKASHIKGLFEVKARPSKNGGLPQSY